MAAGPRKTKKCTGPCGRTRRIEQFRLLKSSGYRQGMCLDCEREYERERWHTRSRKSKQQSGASASRRRLTAVA